MSGVGAFIEADRQERLDRERFRGSRDRSYGQRLSAVVLVCRRFPEWTINGKANSVAVDAVVQLWAERGRGNVTKTLVVQRYELLIGQRQEAMAA